MTEDSKQDNGKRQLPAVSYTTGALMPAVTKEELEANLQALQALVKSQMKEGEHFGIIPGTDKKTLFKAGAELLCEFYQLYPEIVFLDKVEDWDRVPELFDYTIQITLRRRRDDSIVAVGVGSCNSYESKYKYRAKDTGRKCPDCGSGTIKRSGYPNKGGLYKDEKGWYCHAAQGGCGMKWDNPKEPAIVDQLVESVKQFNPDMPSSKNTVLKVAKKRALTDVVIMATRSSAIFTQDQEDFEDDWEVRAVDVEVADKPDEAQKIIAAAGKTRQATKKKDAALEKQEAKVEAVEEALTTTVVQYPSKEDMNALKATGNSNGWSNEEIVKWACERFGITTQTWKDTFTLEMYSETLNHVTTNKREVVAQ
jgi:predicted RNA-binding Zn-ribbon protein involved in translation (DUF1610 family)